MEVTVLTPTYNRGKKLKVLYNSLINQTHQDFLWMIVDDGSNDETKEIIETFIKENKIKIKYLKKENGGKHTALNIGISEIVTDLTFIVDSDDWLETNAIEMICQYHSKYKSNENICGYSFLRKFSNGKINGKNFKKNDIIDNYINIRVNGNDINSDKAEVWKTECLKEYPFPVFDSERFLGEDFVWIQLALKYKMIFINIPIYISEYLEDGLTKNRRVNNINSPKGCYYKSKLILDISKIKRLNMKFLVKNIVQYIIYGNFAKISSKTLYIKCKRKIGFIMLYPISKLIYYKWKKEYITK